ncbi:hypothetical protein TSUD_81860, partial [Trifolium subterraneum]
MTLSSWATSSVEEVASTGPGIRFLQIYVFKDRNMTIQLITKAEKAGFKAIVLTADSPVVGRKEADTKNRFTLPSNMIMKNFEGMDLEKLDEATEHSGHTSTVNRLYDQSLTWKDVKWLQTITSLPILVKGVLTAEDSKLIKTLKSNIAMICFLIHLIFVRIVYIYLELDFTNNVARLAIQAGAAGIIVSNHGARQLDYVPATIMALE